MILSLAAADRSRLASATQALTSPLVAASFEQWLTDVNRSLKALVGADKASFMFPPEGDEIRVSSDEIAHSALESYMRDHLPAIERRWTVRTRTLQFQVFSRRLLLGEHVREFYRSTLYNEFLAPLRAFDSIGMAVALESPSKVVNLLFHHDRPTGRRFSRKSVDLLRLLYPAFTSGVHAARALFPVRQRLTALADAVPVAIALADASGRILHVNRELASFRDADPEWANVDAEIAKVARVRAHVSSVRTCSARYSINCCTLGEGHGSASVPAIVVLVTRTGAAVFPSAALARRYALTGREIDVARLLCTGATNGAIALALSISAATARHHTERVMRKLAVHSRAQIPTVVGALDVQDA